MEPPIPNLTSVPKREAYATLLDLQRVMLDGHGDVIAGMATTAALLHHAFQHLWTGFYRVVEPGKLLRVGPYQGTLGCLDIHFGRGVCGTVAAERRTIVVADVHDFPGHITCDPRSRSEIVVPVVNAHGELLAVLDIDSAVPAAFDSDDQEGLEALMAWFARSSDHDEVLMAHPGYSDRINHAFAYAAKHHDQQVRKGTRLPYFTQPANVAVILTRHGCSEDAVVAGILLDVVQGAVREGWSHALLEERIGQKFGNSVLEILLGITERRVDDDGVDMSGDDRRADRLSRLALASEDGLWALAATEVHSAYTLLSDLRRTSFPETVWARLPHGREATIGWYSSMASRLRELGFTAPVVDELEFAARELSSL